jgi:hypothetical protein
LAALVMGTAALLGSPVAAAQADGDPASDVLALQPSFLPQDAGSSANQQAQLTALLDAARRSGYPIRVAVIASPSDLGSVGELWRQPQTYARFLGEELSLAYQGTLLVVMPDGFGVDRVGHLPPPSPVAGASSLFGGLEPPRLGLGAAAIAATQRLAAASGHPVAVPSATVQVKSGNSATISWIVFVIGALLIVLAWTVSLRVRPWRLRGASH